MNIVCFQPGDSIPGFDSSLLVSQKADEHLCADEGAARCSLWRSVVPVLGTEKLGVIGHFQCSSAEMGAALLEYAAGRLKEQGCTVAIGPMDGNTWRRYRVLTERGAEPVFFMEPDNPDWWQAAFLGARFSALSVYTSSLVKDLARRDPRIGRTRERLAKEGVTIRNLVPERFEEDLKGIYSVSVVSFAHNYLYAEISEEAFLAQYLPYREKIRPELVFLAEHEGKTVGYLFAIPDFAEAMRGEPVRTVIGKTLAVLPGRRYGGLGVVLTNLLHERALAMGFGRVIHALQHEDNERVRNMSEFFGEVMRRYTLFSRRLE